MESDENNECPSCDGTGTSCGIHDTADGCDCEDADREKTCETCHGTGVVDPDEEE